MLVAAYVEQLTKAYAPATVKQHLAAIRRLFDWLVVGQVIPVNPASSVRGPKHVVKTGKTPVLTAAETRELLDTIDTDTLVGLRDRALIGLMVYSFARVSAAVSMKVADVYHQGKRTFFRLHEKGGKYHVVPAHHVAQGYVDDYLDAAGIAGDKKRAAVSIVGSGPPPRWVATKSDDAADGDQDDQAPREGGRATRGDRQSQLSRHRDHRVPAQRRRSGDRRADRRA